MSPGLVVALPGAPLADANHVRAGRPMKTFNLTEWALDHRAVVLFLLLVVAIAGAFGFTRWASSRTRTSPCRR